MATEKKPPTGRRETRRNHRRLTPTERVLLADWEVAELLGVGRTRIGQYNKHGLMPAPIQLPPRPTSGTRWRRQEIIDWVAAGCPPRERWVWTPTRPQTLRERIEDLERLRGVLQAECDALEWQARQKG